MIRVAFVTTGLGTGGAEMALFNLATRLDRERFTPKVFSVRDRGSFGQRLEAAGVAVEAACIGHPGGGVSGLLRLYRALRDFAPHVVQGWMYHGDAVALLASKLQARRRPVLWGIRQSLGDRRDEPLLTSLVVRGCAAASGSPKAIIYNSMAGALDHEAIGFDRSRRLIIPNGFDTRRFEPSAEARVSVRQELGAPDDALLIGYVARFHPVKDHRSFLVAAAEVARAVPNARFVLVGSGVDNANAGLCGLVEQLALQGRVSMLGERSDIPRLTAALDVAVCASRAEGFPNVVGEAMAAGVPCAVTDVGDCATIVGDSGRVCTAEDSAALAGAMIDLATLAPTMRRELGARARQRIEREFSIDAIVRKYETLFTETTQGYV